MNQPLYPLHQADQSTKAAGRRPLQRSSQLLSLEQRFMFDGAVADAAHAAQAHDTAVAAATVPPAVTVRAADPAKDQGRKEVVLVDTSLANYKTLEAGVRDGVGIVEFDGKGDGLAQIAVWAATQSGLDAIHILSHGDDGVLNLGTSRITTASLSSASVQAELAELGQALSADGDLLLYGCDVAAGDGATLLAGLAKATGADIAASTNLTGAARLGGDWTLESHTGTIEARELALTDYDHLLINVDITTGYAYGAPSFTKIVGGATLTFTIIPGTEDPLHAGFFSGYYPDIAWVMSFNNTYASGLIVTVSAGYIFDMTSATGAVSGTVTYHPTGGAASDATHSGLVATDVNGEIIEDTYSLTTLKGMTQLKISSVDTGGSTDGSLFFSSFGIVAHLLPTTTVNVSSLTYDTGNSSSDFLTKTAANGFSGTLSAQLTATQKVQVSYDGGTLWSDATTYAANSSNWSVDTTLVEGTHTIQVRVAESYDGGSTYYGGTAKSQTYTLDTVPSNTSFNTIRFSADTGSSNTDLNTNTGTQDIKATLSATLDVGEKVWVSTTGVNGSYTDVTSFVSSQTLNWTNQTLVGSNTLAFKVTDAAGNDSTPTTQAYVIDTTPPTAYATSVALSNDSGTPGDLITNNPAQTISGNLSANLGANESVQVSIANGAWATASVIGSGWSLTNQTLTGSTSTIRVKVTDLAGNDSATVYSANYTLDTSGPTVTFTNVHLQTDSGNSATDFITNEASQTIHATLLGTLDANDLVLGSLDNGVQWSNITSKLSGNTLTWDGLTLSGTSSIKLKVVDNANNDSTTIYSHSYTIDSATPSAPPTPTLATLSDTGVLNNDKLTNDTTPTLTGSAEADSTVTIYDGATKLGTAMASASGVWNYTTAALSGASHSFTVTATDTAGNVSTASQALTITLDTTAPAIASVDVPANGSYRANTALTFSVHTDDLVYVDTSGGTPRLQLTIGANTRYASYVSGSGSSTLVFSYTVQAGENDSDGIAVNAIQLNNGDITDAAGNTLGNTLNNLGATTSVLVDTAAPVATSVGVPNNATYYTGEALDFVINYNEAVTVNTSSGTPYIELDVGGVTRHASYVAGSGSTGLLFRYNVVNGDTDANGVTVNGLYLNNGSINDAAGNAGSATLNSIGNTGGVLVDGSQPSITNVSSTANGSYGAGSTISITVSFSAAVEVNTTGGIPTLALSSGGTATYFSGGGSNTLVFHYTVGAGENSADLDYASSAALSLNNALIYESNGAGRNASVTLLAPGTAGSLGANRDIVIDTIAPAITGSTVVFSNDTGSSATDLITKQASQTEIRGTLNGTLASNETVMVSLDNGASWIIAVAAGSNWTIDARTLSGSNTIKVYVKDAAGNTGSTATFDYVLDQTGPSTTFGTIRFSSDTGSSKIDLITNATAQTVSATLSSALAAGEQVFGSYDGGNSWRDITDKVSGTTLSWDGVTLASSNTLQFYVRDVAGNDGTMTYKSYVLDTTPPGTSVISAGFSDDTGSSNSDFITKVGTQTVSGTLSANLLAGETVYVSTDNGGTWQAATSDGRDGWSVSNMSLTSVGANATLLVKVSDTAGNDGNILSQAYTYDTTAPTAASVTPLTTQSLTPVLSGSATLAPGDSMTVSVGGATYDVTPVAGAWTLDLASAVPATGALTLVLNNQYHVTATITDTAGNSSNDTTSGELIVGTLAQPATPPTTTAGGATLSNDSGASNSDFITNIAQQTISGSLSAPLQVGERVEVSLDGGTSWSNAAASGSSWSFSASLAGSGNLQVRVSGDGGNGAVYSRAYTLDTTPPAAPLADAFSSSSLTPVLNGAATLADGETLSVAVGGANYAVSVVNGRWTLDLARATPASGALSLTAGGSYSVVATVTDLAGNRSSGSGTLTINTLPGVTSMTLSADSGSSNSDFITNVAAQTVSGGLSAPLAADQTVQLSLDGGATWQNASVSGTSWSASVALSGSNTLVARVASAGGNGASLARAYVLDTTAPVATPVLSTQTADGAISGSLSAPLGSGESVLVSRDNGSTWSTLSSSAQAWSLSLNGASSALLQVRDAAGNAGRTLTVSALPTTPTEPEVPPPVRPETPVQPESPVQPDAPQQPTTAGPVTALTPNGETPGAAGSPGQTQPVPPAVLPPLGSGNEIITTWPGQAPPTVIDTLPTFVTLQPMPEIQSLTGNAFQILTLPELPGSAALVAYTPIPDIASASGERISVQIGSDAFAHSGDSANVTLSAQMADGTTLPGWLRFDGRTARFEGTPPPAFEGTLSFRVTARDSQGRVATQMFKIVVSKDGAKTGYWQGEPADPVGRASLGEQMRSARSSAAARLVALSS
ncbi:DUF4347 domain-containing protein [Duganella sp. sic0402]|uniref:Ig-like domain-containing protein n=1 Tax=Duganella sp. sic0402 TaxID=2854786 RepID=UPI001C475430|nr:Ig-like domain-containing protein [Duganella sp. sic0402]MBV7536929.1 DUF4347 domain-containing protein [Duganella sp. sic0402]